MRIKDLFSTTTILRSSAQLKYHNYFKIPPAINKRMLEDAQIPTILISTYTGPVSESSISTSKLIFT